MAPFWMTVFLDFAPEDHDAGVMHWMLLTGYGLSAPRGENGEFATLEPNDGDPIVADADSFLRVQRLGQGPSRLHLDLHVDDVAAASTRAESLGASVVSGNGFRLMRSPGGFTFCFVDAPASRRPAPSGWRGGHHSLVDQVCLDIPHEHWDSEREFWAAVTGWELRSSSLASEFGYLERPREQPVRILLQRLHDPAGEMRAHIDWATTDREAEVQRHLTAGSSVVAVHRRWTVMRGPGTIYCITDRDPRTGTIR